MGGGLITGLLVGTCRHEYERAEQLRTPSGKADTDEPAHRKSGKMDWRPNMLDELRRVFGDRIHIVSAPRYARAAVSAVVVRNDPIAASKIAQLLAIRI